MTEQTSIQSSEPEPESDAHRSGASREALNSPNRKTRPSRPRYIARACKECKRRKVKCNGKTPCHHCDRYDVQCLYPEKNKSEQAGRSVQMETLTKQLEMLQQQVSLLISRQNLSEQNQAPPISALTARSSHQEPQFRVPSLSPAALPVMVGGPSPTSRENPHSDGSLKLMSTEGTVRGVSLSATVDMTDNESSGHPSTSTILPSPASGRLAVACHPLLSISQSEALRLIDLYEDECGSVYPLIDIELIRDFTTQFYDGVTASQTPATWRTFKLDQSSKRQFNLLEIILAIALVVEGHGSTDLSCALMDELEAEIDHRPSGVSADTSLAEILTLMSLYQFYRDEEILAWRTIGLAARIALEIGLHLREPPFAMFHSPQERQNANRLFWCIYCLDRRWSFGTGLPFGIQEDDIDQSLPEPNDSHPYLFTSMIAYSRIGSKILKAPSGSDQFEHSGKREETAFLTYQVQQWYSSLDPELRIDSEQEVVLESLSPARNRLRVLNCLRKNQLRILIHRRALFTLTSVTADPRSARAAVDLAKSTITLLDRLRSISDIYRCHAACFNYYLYSALTVILLATYHCKAQFHEYCREEFHMALNLIGGVSAKSHVARKLWKIIKHLKIMGPEIGILPYMEAQQDTHTNGRQDPNSQVEMNPNPHGLAFNNDSIVNPSPPQTTSPELNGFGNGILYGEPNFFTSDYAVDGSLLSSELSDIFQAIDPSRFQIFDNQRPQPSTVQMAHDFSRSVRNVF